MKNTRILSSWFSPFFALSVSALLFLSPTASAQRIPELLPEGTFFALGLYDLHGARDRAQAFVTEFERLELGQALAAILGDSLSNDASDDIDDVADLLNPPEGMGWLEFLGEEAWIASTLSTFSPVPSAVAATVISDPALQQTLAGRLTDYEGTRETLTEGAYTFYIQMLEDDDVPLPGVAYALADDVLLLSSNPDTLRGMLRQLGGNAEPNLSSNPNYTATLGAFAEQTEPAFLYSYLDADALTNLTGALAGMGFDSAVARLDAILKTFNTGASVARLTDAGIVSGSRVAPNAQGGDALLYQLLTDATPVDVARTAALAPRSTLNYATNTFNAQNFWAWLDDVALNIPEFGMSLTDVAESTLNVDVQNDVLGWMDSQWTSIMAVPPVVIEPGKAVDNFLGDAVYVVATTNEAQAKTGLARAGKALANFVGPFSDPTGGSGQTSVDTRTIAGVDTTVYTMADGIVLFTAVYNGHAFFSGSEEGLKTVLETVADGINAPNLTQNAAYSTLQTLAQRDNLTGLSYNDDQATSNVAAQQLITQLQTLAGLSGASNIDFDRIEAASADIEAFLQFAVPRLGNTVSETYIEDGMILSKSLMDVQW